MAADAEASAGLTGPEVVARWNQLLMILQVALEAESGSLR